MWRSIGALLALLLALRASSAAAEDEQKLDVRIRFDQPNANVEYVGWQGLRGPDWREPGDSSELRLALAAGEYHLVVTLYDTRDPKKHCKLAVALNGRPVGTFERGQHEGWFAWHIILPKDAFAPGGKQSLRFVRTGEPIAVQEVRLCNYWPPAELPPPLPRFHRTGWNVHASHFMHPPAFTANELKEAVSYAFTIRWSGPDQKPATRGMRSEKPSFDLTGIWRELPAATRYNVAIEAVDAQGKVVDRLSFGFLKVADFDPRGNYPKAKHDYAESGRRDAEYLLRRLEAWKRGPSGDLGAFPALFGSAYIRLLTTYAQLAPESAMAKDAVVVAGNIGQHMLRTSTPRDWAYPSMPRSHAGEVLQVCRTGMVGLAYLDLLAATGDKAFLNAASAIADSLKATQRPEGRWPFRVNARTGAIVEDYTSDQAEAILLLDALLAGHGRSDLAETRNKAVRWMLENPVKSRHWQQQWDDVGLLPPYRNLEFYDAALFALYLLRHATPENGYRAIALDLCRYIEDQFVLWENSAFPAALVPTVLEQYVCYQPIDWHVAHYIRVCQAVHEATGEAMWLQKAQVMADNLTVVQHPDGYYPTWMRRAKATAPTAPPAVDYSDLWLNCTSYTGEILLKLAAHLSKPLKQ
ncbi:MAG: hypothetical protein FJ290_16730 [Planctomycetes bacterium]|nr:hypothetical protein [Planctomycetota bacterium]